MTSSNLCRAPETISYQRLPQTAGESALRLRKTMVSSKQLMQRSSAIWHLPVYRYAVIFTTEALSNTQRAVFMLHDPWEALCVKAAACQTCDTQSVLCILVFGRVTPQLSIKALNRSLALLRWWRHFSLWPEWIVVQMKPALECQEGKDVKHNELNDFFSSFFL